MDDYKVPSEYEESYERIQQAVEELDCITSHISPIGAVSLVTSEELQNYLCGVSGSILFEYMQYRTEVINHIAMKHETDPTMPIEVREVMNDIHLRDLAIWLDGFLTSRLLDKERRENE